MLNVRGIAMKGNSPSLVLLAMLACVLGFAAKARADVPKAKTAANPDVPKAKTAAKAKLAPERAATVRTKQPCYAPPVALMRVRGVLAEPREVSLTFCNGKPNPAAVDAVSLLARPRDVERPLLPEIRAYRARPVLPKKLANATVTVKNAAAVAKAKKKYRDPQFVTEQVMRIDPGLLSRLQRIADRYPGRTIEIISGYRPDSRETSRHHHGLALDMRVAGIAREKLRDFVRTFDKTGCGYYPNSYFVHMDVRDEKGYWVDRSGPGEPADYGPWPPTKQDLDRQREGVLRDALAAVSQLGNANGGPRQDAIAQAAPTHLRNARTEPRAASASREPEQEPDDMRQDEIARVREEARRALEQL